MRFKLGLTGSIGMGKSQTAAFFAEAGCPVWDADAAVHRLYGAGGAAVAAIGAMFPQAIVDGAVSREALRAVIAADATALSRIEAIVHPLVQADRAEFAKTHPEAIGVFDIPLLYETGSEGEFDAVACVTIPEEIQRERVLARGTMSAADLDRILARQLPAAEKRARADFVITTDTLDHARAQVQDVLKKIERRIDA
ncbi:dephospho-CoA kinase [Yangia mangrovi]|uniref:Dephospho-CoA kinase n=1 Tax=Alloyangia mangrovi TaxID=1779329 RepID=A0A2A3JUS6_9RHOB|nr:dephospho-CoA kinase [Alloyangia mangrovi]MCA0940265.1 dephospho-CoA kinase [Alloyangia pacifica]MCA0945338.1 dephospho-CoA kinase [Alloyangia pacifica]MCT4369751.1 dephospho-CoA kinase [Alloyangia mangrovi]